MENPDADEFIESQSNTAYPDHPERPANSERIPPDFPVHIVGAGIQSAPVNTPSLHYGHALLWDYYPHAPIPTSRMDEQVKSEAAHQGHEQEQKPPPSDGKQEPRKGYEQGEPHRKEYARKEEQRDDEGEILPQPVRQFIKV